jgi:hypothetical protein
MVGPFANGRDGSLVTQDNRIDHVATADASPGIQPSQSRIMLVQWDVDEEIVAAWTRIHAQQPVEGVAQLCRLYDYRQDVDGSRYVGGVHLALEA